MFKVTSNENKIFDSKHKKELGTDYNEIIMNCNEWSKSFYQSIFQPDIRALITNESFNKIVNAHHSLIKQNLKEGILPLLQELIEANHSEFLIPMAYISHQIPEGHNNTHVGLMGSAQELLHLIDQH